MATTLESLGMDRLSVEEPLALVFSIEDSIAAEPNRLTVTPAERTLIAEREAAYEANPTSGDSWKIVKERLKARRK